MATTIVIPERRIAWSAVFSGVAVAIAVQLMLNLLGAGIGFAAAPAADTSTGVKAIGIGAALWWMVSGLVAMYVGGWVAGRQAPVGYEGSGSFHGFITWAATAIVGLVLATTLAGAVFGSSMSVINRGTPQAYIMNNTRVSEASLGATADDMERKGEAFNGAVVPQRKVDDESARAIAVASLWAFAALLLGALVSTAGGKAGMRRQIAGPPRNDIPAGA